MAQLVAHRGHNSDLPENTLEAIGEAIRCGATAVEFDLQMSADRVPVVCHDMSLQRTAGVAVEIAARAHAELAAIGVGEPLRFGAAFSAVRLPSLRQVVALLAAAPQVTAFIELKGESIATFGVEAFVRQVAREIEAIAAQCVVIADSLASLLAMRQRCDVRIGWIVHRWEEADRRQARQSGVDFLVIGHEHCRDHDFGADPWEWVVYETSDPAHAAALFAQGVQYVETNDLCTMLRALPGCRAHRAS